MKRQQYTQTCEICKKELSHEKELVAKQMLGYHKRTAHGIPGVANDREARNRDSRERHWINAGCTGAKLEEMRARYAAKQSATPTAEEPLRKTKSARDAVPLALTSCPMCKAAFWYTKPTE